MYERIDDGIFWKNSRQRWEDRQRDSGYCLSCGKPTGGTQRCKACMGRQVLRRHNKQVQVLMAAGASDRALARAVIGPALRKAKLDTRRRQDPLKVRCEKCGKVSEMTNWSNKRNRCPACWSVLLDIPLACRRELLLLT